MKVLRKKYIRAIIVAFLFAANLDAIAEYRAYQYILKSKILNQSVESTPMQSIVVSTLSPVSFIAYNGGESAIEATLINSWMCPGYTAKLGTCKPPIQEFNGN
tara:strand:- start:389 stop:697 length:309 start_codon:yes stop_codon:yes gene_type:complete